MKKVIGIINPGWIKLSDLDDINACRGGSETWIMQLSAEFQKRGYHVMVYSNCDGWYFNKFGVEFIPFELLQSQIQFRRFDHLIISRFLSDYIQDIVDSDCFGDLVIQAHDIYVGKLVGPEMPPMKWGEIPEFSDQNEKLKGVIALTRSHASTLNYWNDIPESKIYQIPNGINLDLIPSLRQDQGQLRDYDILWSSRPERGLDILVNEILPLLKDRGYQTKIKVASYDHIPDWLYEKDSSEVQILGKLSKEELYQEMRKHRVWFYPAIFPETFCITALENVLNGCIPIMPWKDGMATTLAPFWPYECSEMQEYERDWDYNIIADRIASIFDNYYTTDKQCQISSMESWIRSKYTWDKVVDLYEELWSTF